MFSLSGQSRSGGSCMRKVRRGVAAALVGCLAVSGCSGGKPEGQGADGSESGSPFAAPEDSTPTVPEYKVEDGLVLSADDKRLADEAVVFFTEYMAAANRAYKDGGVYWDKYIDMSAEDLKKANEQARDDQDSKGLRAVNDLRYQSPKVLDFGVDEDAVFLASCLDFRNWERTTNDGPLRPEGEDPMPAMGFYLRKENNGWKAAELYVENPSCNIK